MLIHNAEIINEGRRFRGYVAVDGCFITEVGEGDAPQTLLEVHGEIIDASMKWLVPGAIDTHVHFRDGGDGSPKGDIASESRAAVAGGVTTFFDMPNTTPPTVTLEAWKRKMEKAAAKSAANYAFFMGATNGNLDQLLEADYSRVPGVKLFMGSSTGNMLVDDSNAIRQLFERLECVIAVHAESQPVISGNVKKYREKYGEPVPVGLHPEIRSRRACVESSGLAVGLARATGARLHVLHISTSDELELFAPGPLSGKRITAETCPHYLIFGGGSDYERYGTRVKCNPAIKERSDREALLKAVIDGRIDVIATDHAPHLPADKKGDALTAASGMPGVQFSLPLMLSMTDREPGLTPERVVELMSHNPATLYGIDRRGFIRRGYYADLVLIAETDREIADSDVVSTCGWTPYAGMELMRRVDRVWVNGGNHALACRFRTRGEIKD